jgi:hypothetical protein
MLDRNAWRSRVRQPRFWSAVGGMAAAVAIACAVVAMEMAGRFGARAVHFRHRADRLQARLGQVEAQLNAANQQVAAMKEQTTLRQLFNRVAAAPDSRLIRLMPSHQVGAARGVLALSPQLSKAILKIMDLPDQSGNPFAVYWVTRRGGAILASALPVATSAQSDVILELPLPPADTTAVMVARSSSSASAGNGVAAPLLRGDFKVVKPPGSR